MGNLMKMGIGVPIGLISLLAMMILPLPPVMLDVLFTFNIALSLVIVMAVFNVRRPLEFAIFPTVLLLVTILRLALNVASTRVVLMHGHEGSHAAGKVIAAFGEFVIGGNYAVGAVVFIILTIINFVVVTKGAGRVSEVSARFALDAMPGKQMAIDADLNAGLITQDEARARRLEVRAESDFYGSMDGASKFVRGDAVAGILIMVINIIGGLLIGTMMHGLPMADATKTYTLLTIGDGLGGADPRPHAVGGRCHHRDSRDPRAGHGRRAAEAVVWPAQGAWRRGRDSRHHGRYPRHAQYRVPVDRGNLRICRVAPRQEARSGGTHA
jgi:flagellar biosynthesis protein FlhA